MSGIQFIERDGKREYAIVPMEIFERLVQVSGAIDDVALYDQAKAADDGARVPDEVAGAILEGMHPVKAWRKYRSLTQRALAEEAKISKPFLSQIESGKRVGTIAVLAALARALQVPVDFLAD
ncbi:helix-turn-helix domain-containing protein [Nitrosovibrio sp. Nv17]|jgi:DNA-binding XRE family transcriptional regulator|uniref:helix-turn-helix domain-containing protein n=1 Tax=Nitrosovibrio sp. Nv17 TaxID=1855339 RepID=UPI0009086255|nr:helix-turn-helix transcriptional regulator [Nitrosovibrio sp. Nv17]SFW39578.1 Helix-turn-helix domain-containing protein [Nitrosovibrio sp. Nv17]